MKKTSLAEAQANLPALVAAAEYRRRRTLILRHGKAVAVIVPMPREATRSLTPEEVDGLFDALGKSASDRSAVIELISERR